MRSDYFTKEETTVLKGAFALLILMHHLYQHTLIGEDFPFVDYFFRSLGYIGVAGFLFFSGYGLTISNLRSNGVYVEGFIKKRVIPFYYINVILIIIYTVANIVLYWGGNF